MKVQEVMTADKLKYCSPETKLQDAAKTMKSENIGALPVLDKDKKVVGLVTDRDICLSLTKKMTKPGFVSVGEIMAKKVYTVGATEELSSALRQMRVNKVGRVPVIDEKGKLKGIVSLHKLLSDATQGKKLELGSVSSPDETVLKTVQAITERYSNGKVKK